MKATSHGMHAHMYNMEDDGDSHRDKVSVSSTSTKIGTYIIYMIFKLLIIIRTKFSN